MKTILAPVDFSTASDCVVNQAASLARSVNARVVLISVIQPPTISGEFAPLLDNLAEITATGEKTVARKLAAFETSLRSEGIEAESVQFVGVPVKHILEQAKKLSVDYIVMGSHGHTALYDLLVGSTTHGVLMRAPCPVVVIPPGRLQTAPPPQQHDYAMI